MEELPIRTNRGQAHVAGRLGLPVVVVQEPESGLAVGRPGEQCDQPVVAADFHLIDAGAPSQVDFSGLGFQDVARLAGMQMLDVGAKRDRQGAVGIGGQGEGGVGEGEQEAAVGGAQLFRCSCLS